MAFRKSWKLGPSKKITKKKKKSGKAKEKDHHPFLNLPSDLLQLIISHLPLKDNIRASAVCKTLHEACVWALVTENSPWLIYFSKTGSYELYDPSNQKTFTLFKFPDLSDFLTQRFDKIISKELPHTIVYEDDEVLAFEDIAPRGPVHILLIPKLKDGLSGLSKAEERLIDILGRLLYTAKLVAEQQGLEKGFRIVINDGLQGSQLVNHIHVHLVGGRQMN